MALTWSMVVADQTCQAQSNAQFCQYPNNLCGLDPISRSVLPSGLGAWDRFAISSAPSSDQFVITPNSPASLPCSAPQMLGCCSQYFDPDLQCPQGKVHRRTRSFVQSSSSDPLERCERSKKELPQRAAIIQSLEHAEAHANRLRCTRSCNFSLMCPAKPGNLVALSKRYAHTVKFCQTLPGVARTHAPQLPFTVPMYRIHPAYLHHTCNFDSHPKLPIGLSHHSKSPRSTRAAIARSCADQDRLTPFLSMTTQGPAKCHAPPVGCQYRMFSFPCVRSHLAGRCSRVTLMPFQVARAASMNQIHPQSTFNIQNHRTARPSDETALMQLSATIAAEAPSIGSSSESIPADWYIDLQRRVAQLEAQCHTEYDGELIFTVYTWFLDHAIESKSSEAKLATLGGYPPDWRSDILYPWHHRIIPGEEIHINLVSPNMARLSFQEHIAHVLITQRRSELVSTLLVVELQYHRPMIFRSALALPSKCTKQEVLQLSPIATEYEGFLHWDNPRLSPLAHEFTAADGLGIHLLVDPSELPQPRDRGEVAASSSSVLPQEPVSQAGPSQHPPPVPDDSFPSHGGSFPAVEPQTHAVDLPNSNEEPTQYQFNVHAPVFVPGAPALATQSEFVQDLHHARNLVAFSWQDQLQRQTYVVTWFVDHRFHYPICDASRRVLLDHRYHEWEQQIRDRWADSIDPALPVEIELVMPAPPRLEPGVVAHVILVQSPRPEWESSLVSVDDDVFTRINSGTMVRLVITTPEHFTIEQVVAICGYPTTCTCAMQALRCFAWIQQYQLLPGRLWPGRPGTSIHLRIIRTPSNIVQVPPEQPPEDHLAMYQTGTHLIRRQPSHPGLVGTYKVHTEVPHLGDDQIAEDTISLLAHGVRQRVRPPPALPVANIEQIAQQQEDPEPPPESSDDESSSTDPNWQDTMLYSPVCDPARRHLLIVSPRTRAYQITRAFGWEPGVVQQDIPLHTYPRDLVAQRLHGRVVRRRDDLTPNSILVLVLIDVVFHPSPPSWDRDVIRKAMYVLPTLTARQFIRSMYLQPYMHIMTTLALSTTMMKPGPKTQTILMISRMVTTWLFMFPHRTLSMAPYRPGAWQLRSIKI